MKRVLFYLFVIAPLVIFFLGGLSSPLDKGRYQIVSCATIPNEKDWPTCMLDTRTGDLYGTAPLQSGINPPTWMKVTVRPKLFE